MNLPDPSACRWRVSYSVCGEPQLVGYFDCAYEATQAAQRFRERCCYWPAVCHRGDDGAWRATDVGQH